MHSQELVAIPAQVVAYGPYIVRPHCRERIHCTIRSRAGLQILPPCRPIPPREERLIISAVGRGAVVARQPQVRGPYRYDLSEALTHACLWTAHDGPLRAVPMLYQAMRRVG